MSSVIRFPAQRVRRMKEGFTSDLKNGVVQIAQCDDDLYYLQWINKETLLAEDLEVLYRGEVEVTQAELNSTHAVFTFKFKSKQVHLNYTVERGRSKEIYERITSMMDTLPEAKKDALELSELDSAARLTLLSAESSAESSAASFPSPMTKEKLEKLLDDVRDKSEDKSFLDEMEKLEDFEESMKSLTDGELSVFIDKCADSLVESYRAEDRKPTVILPLTIKDITESIAKTKNLEAESAAVTCFNNTAILLTVLNLPGIVKRWEVFNPNAKLPETFTQLVDAMKNDGFLKDLKLFREAIDGDAFGLPLSADGLDRLPILAALDAVSHLANEEPGDENEGV